MALVTLARAAHATPSLDECLSANESSIQLRGQHKLRAAKAQLLVCAEPTCPGEIRDACAHRLDEVAVALTTVVFIVKSVDDELSAVKVTMDGELVADHLDGSAITLDPGPHQFTFESAGHPSVTKSLTLHEGEKGRRETLTISEPPTVAPPVVPPPVVVTTPVERHSNNAGVIGGVVTGGLGVVALGVGFVFGAIASSSWSTAKNECPTFMGCSAQALNDRNNAVTFATTSTVTVIAGGVLAVGGLALFLLFPKHSTTVGVNASGLVGHF